VRDGAELLETTFAAPHDLAGCPVESGAPVGPGAELIQELTERSKAILADHPVNRRRRERGLLPATQIWLFWPGMRPGSMPTFAGAYRGRRAAMTTGVDLLRGLALQTGVDILDLPGVSDGASNDFAGQMAGALKALDDHDVVFVHVEAPDDAGHAGDAGGKVRAIERCDELMVAQVLERAQAPAGAGSRGAAAGPGAPHTQGIRLLVLPDHPTPVELMTHVAEPVPFVMWGPGIEASGAKAYTEAEARAADFAVAPGHLLMSLFLEGGAEGGAAECR